MALLCHSSLCCSKVVIINKTSFSCLHQTTMWEIVPCQTNHPKTFGGPMGFLEEVNRHECFFACIIIVLNRELAEQYGHNGDQISHSESLITYKELFKLLEENASRNPDFSYDSYDLCDLENMEEAECKSEFRVDQRCAIFLL